MKKENLMYAIEAVIWFFFIYYFLYTIKNPVNLWVSALILLVLGYIGTITCPWFVMFTKHLKNKKK
ncbi:MAG TPA: hypothetical protein QGG70_01170 [Candidatus Pacearchaeota archaeon]|jgi:hypothetical protein|nr:hypothetical protein [Candidatus Pacearchaeota archaeon]